MLNIHFYTFGRGCRTIVVDKEVDDSNVFRGTIASPTFSTTSSLSTVQINNRKVNSSKFSLVTIIPIFSLNRISLFLFLTEVCASIIRFFFRSSSFWNTLNMFCMVDGFCANWSFIVTLSLTLANFEKLHFNFVISTVRECASLSQSMVKSTELFFRGRYRRPDSLDDSSLALCPPEVVLLCEDSKLKYCFRVLACATMSDCFSMGFSGWS